ncbi:MAG: ParB/RepB/Spo0J family partition protein [Desulfobacterales bacterium]|nr:ParB/RepB/Spo0J family partition protein [Desulfobacterales bacterium]
MKKGQTQKEITDGSRKKPKKALGRGLGSLIPGMESMEELSSRDYFQCDINMIRPNRYQPRVRFSEEDLESLSASIKEQGVIQPLLVRKEGNFYELIAGERRFRASQRAGLSQVPVVIKSISDAEMLEMSIVENIQRSDLNPIEEADAYHRLMTEFALTQDQTAVRVGKSRSAVANFLRIRQLPDRVKTSIMDGKLSMGHARAILGTGVKAQQIAVWRSIIAKGLSVRETEKLIKKLKDEKTEDRPPRRSSEDLYFSDLAEELSRNFGTKVQIKRRGQRGSVQIEFYSNDDLDRLLGLLGKK